MGKDYFRIEGGVPLQGEVTPGGNKNAALPLMAATLLTDEPVVLHNIPRIRDVWTMRRLLESLGVEVQELGPHSWRFHARQVRPTEPDARLVQQIRASLLLAGPMLVRSGHLVLAPPGGDVIGRRRVDTHVLALQALGAQVDFDRVAKRFTFHAKQPLQGREVLLDEASVTATENAVMAAVLARGTTVLRNAASEPHVQELCRMLVQMGARIQGIGSNVLVIEGVPRLHGTEFTIGPDYIETVGYIAAAAITRGSIRIRNAGTRYLAMARLVFGRLGVVWEEEGDDVLVPAEQPLEIQPDIGQAIPEITTMPWPGFPTDMMSIAIVVATQARGAILFHDWMYNSRMFFTDKLVRMGAQIVLCDPHRCIVNGPTPLVGEILESPDIRAGMALVLAALAARGVSEIHNIQQIDRGYERVDEKLRGLGARIWRLQEGIPTQAPGVQ